MKKPKPEGIKIGEFMMMLTAISIILILLLIKVYISNKIYYESREYAIIYHEVSALREENRILKTNVEKLKYKTRVEDTVDSYDEFSYVDETIDNELNQEDKKQEDEGNVN